MNRNDIDNEANPVVVSLAQKKQISKEELPSVNNLSIGLQVSPLLRELKPLPSERGFSSSKSTVEPFEEHFKSFLNFHSNSTVSHEIFSTWIINYRQRHNLSQEDFALQMGVNKNSIKNWEKNSFPEKPQGAKLLRLFHKEVVCGRFIRDCGSDILTFKDPHSKFYGRHLLEDILSAIQEGYFFTAVRRLETYYTIICSTDLSELISNNDHIIVGLLLEQIIMRQTSFIGLIKNSHSSMVAVIDKAYVLSPINPKLQYHLQTFADELKFNHLTSLQNRTSVEFVGGVEALLRHAEILIEMEPDYPHAYFNLAFAASLSSQQSACRKAYKKLEEFLKRKYTNISDSQIKKRLQSPELKRLRELVGIN